LKCRYNNSKKAESSITTYNINNGKGVVRLTGFSYKKMCGHFARPKKKTGRNYEVTVRQRSTVRVIITGKGKQIRIYTAAKQHSEI